MIANPDDEDLDNSVGETDTPATRVFVKPQDMLTSTLFSKDVELDDIIQDVKGLKWSVDYFLQLANVNDALAEPDMNIPPSVQKYHRIRNLIVTLQTPIDQTNIEDITGSAIVNSGFLPNKHDVFKATLTGGREAVFIITNVDIKHYNIHQIYTIDFKLHLLIDNDATPLYNNILLKVTKEYVYDKEHLLDYSAPIILATDYTAKMNYKKRLPELYDYYLKTFIEPTFNIIAPPTNASVYLDPLVSDFIFKVIGVNDHERMLKITRLDVGDELKDITIWDVILRRDKELLKRANYRIGYQYTPNSATYPTLRSLSYLKINFVLRKLTVDEIAVMPTYKALSNSRDNTYVDPITLTGMEYVFSKSFYENALTTQQPFEQLVYAYLNEEVLDTTLMSKLLDQYHQWDTREQFYLIPILIILVKDVISRAYKSI